MHEMMCLDRTKKTQSKMAITVNEGSKIVINIHYLDLWKRKKKQNRIFHLMHVKETNLNKKTLTDLMKLKIN